MRAALLLAPDDDNPLTYHFPQRYEAATGDVLTLETRRLSASGIETISTDSIQLSEPKSLEFFQLEARNALDRLPQNAIYAVRVVTAAGETVCQRSTYDLVRELSGEKIITVRCMSAARLFLGIKE
jgi:hypothetical protein